MPPSPSFQAFPCLRFISRADLFGRELSPLVSLSGGQDSIFLSWFVFHVQDERQLRPIGLYHNHLWHAEGFFHGLHCLRLTFLFGWPFLYTMPMHPVFDERQAWGFRHHLRGRLALFYDTPQVLLGHTKTDRMETFLFHLFRGSLQRHDPLPEQCDFRDNPFPVITDHSSNFTQDDTFILTDAQGASRSASRSASGEAPFTGVYGNFTDSELADSEAVTGLREALREARCDDGQALLFKQKPSFPTSAYQLIRSKVSC